MDDRLLAMRFPFIIVLFALLLAGTASAQDGAVVPDTLDWKRYYPLGIGNTWEYGGLNAYTSTIVGDTLANNRQYFVRRDSIPAVGTLGPFIQFFYMRYDTSGTVVTVPDVESDTLAVPLPFSYQQIEFPDFLAYFDMRTAFGDTLYYRPPDTLYHVFGGYNRTRQIGDAHVEMEGLKCFQSAGTLLHNACYGTDIGFLGGGNLFSSRLKYARVGGKEYGEVRMPATAVDEHVSASAFVIESIYPHPLRREGHIVYTLGKPGVVRIELFNALGQTVHSEVLGDQLPGEHRYRIDRDGLASGMYIMRLSTATGQRVVRSIILSK